MLKEKRDKIGEHDIKQKDFQHVCSDKLTLDKTINYEDDEPILTCEKCQFETQNVLLLNERETHSI